MSASPRNNFFISVLRGFWRALDGLRRVLHLVILLFIALLVLAALTPASLVMQKDSALVLAPSGQLVDQLSGSPIDRTLARVQGLPAQETLLRDLLEALALAREDERIDAVVLDLSMLTGGGLSKLQELAAALRDFRESGKPVIAYGEGFSQGQYLVAAQADELHLHPAGGVMLQGFGYYLSFYRRALDSLLIDLNVVTVGEFKSMGEPFTRDDMSEGEREVARAWLGSLWALYREEVASARGFEAVALDRYIDQLVPALEAVDGDLAQMALDAGMVDSLRHRDELGERMRELVAADHDSIDGFRGIDHDSYLAAFRASSPYKRDLKRMRDGDTVAVVTAAGMILPGEQSPGSIGSDSTARLVREARENDRVRAMVLRIDSGGGSAFASEVLLRELAQFRESGKPLVVSMGSVAASGGYMMALAGEQIWASPTTLTGSIGVFSLFPTVQRGLDRLGISSDGVGTSWLAGQFQPDRELDERSRRVLELTAEHIYERFVGAVAQGRGLSEPELDAVTQGRVFSGVQALDNGLIDRLGNLDDAVDAAAGLAGLAPGSFRVGHVEPELSFMQRFALGVLGFGEPGVAMVRAIVGARGPANLLQGVMQRLEREVLLMQAFGDPRGVAAYCLVCEID